MEADYVVVGGGVAGVSCVEELVDLMEVGGNGETTSTNKREPKIVLVSGRSGFIKIATNAEKLGEVAESFQVEERRADEHFVSPLVVVRQVGAVGWNAAQRVLQLSDGSSLHYRKLCIASGAHAKRTFHHPNVVTIRDLESIAELRAKLAKCNRRVLLIGNGGIATELIFELLNVGELVWAIRHSTIAATYFDEAAAQFFEPKLRGGREAEPKSKPEVKSDRYTVYARREGDDLGVELQRISEMPNRDAEGNESEAGCALGPHWLAKLRQHVDETKASPRKIHVLSNTEIVEIKDFDSTAHDRERLALINSDLRVLSDAELPWQVWAETRDGTGFGCDLVIEATGVTPNSELWSRDCSELRLAEDCGIAVDDWMRTSVDGVFAAGDVCTLLSAEEKLHWTQIRLWTQARQMGTFAARCMCVPNVLPDIAFDLFTHVTTFFGYKVVLLGDFSAAKARTPYKTHYRIGDRRSGEADEYIKVITKDSRVIGAVLIGETELEETMENLILNGTNVGQIEDDLLNPEIELDDYFD